MATTFDKTKMAEELEGISVDDVFREHAAATAPEESEPEVDQQGAEPEPEPQPEEPSTVKFLGRTLADHEARDVLALYEWARDNPEKYAEFVAFDRGSKVMVAPEELADLRRRQQTAADDDGEWVDPEDRIARLETQTEQIASWQQRQQESFIANSVEQSLRDFRQSHPELSQDDWDKLMTKMNDEEILVDFVGRHPIERWPERVRKAVALTYHDMFFDKQKESGANQAVRDMRTARKKAVGGAKGQAIRTEPPPTTPAGIRAAMAADIRAAQES